MIILSTRTQTLSHYAIITIYLKLLDKNGVNLNGEGIEVLI